VLVSLIMFKSLGLKRLSRFYIGKIVLNRLFADHTLVGLMSSRISNDDEDDETDRKNIM